MTLSEVPIIKLVELTEYKTKPSRYPMVGKLTTRALLGGLSESGKGILLNSIIDYYFRYFS